MRTRARLLALAALLPLWAPGAARAAEGRLAYVSGRVSVESFGKSEAGKAGLAVPSGTAVATGPRSTAVVSLPDGSTLKLRARTRLVVSLPDRPSAFTEAYLQAGGVFAKVAKQVKEHFRVRTQSAVAAVRGTQFFTSFGRGRDLWICVRDGVVEVSARGSAKTADLSAGQGVLIKGGTNLTQPQAYDWTKKLNWNMDAAGGPVEDKTDLDAAYSDLLDQDYR